MKYQKVLITKSGDTSIYCYRLGWALDAEASYISADKDVCIGFDSTKDFCFSGSPDIYYELRNDTLNIYSNDISTVPKVFPIVFKATELHLLKMNEFEKKFKSGKIRKIQFDTIIQNVKCKAIPNSPIQNMKFMRK